MARQLLKFKVFLEECQNLPAGSHLGKFLLDRSRSPDQNFKIRNEQGLTFVQILVDGEKELFGILTHIEVNYQLGVMSIGLITPEHVFRDIPFAKLIRFGQWQPDNVVMKGRKAYVGMKPVNPPIKEGPFNPCRSLTAAGMPRAHHAGA